MYPTFLYHPTHGPRLFTEDAEMDATIAEEDGWRDRPWSPDERAAQADAQVLADALTREQALAAAQTAPPDTAMLVAPSDAPADAPPTPKAKAKAPAKKSAPAE